MKSAGSTSEKLLGIDVGTTGTKAVVFDINGTLLSRGYTEYGVVTPKPNWSEQAPEVWWNAVLKSVREAINRARISSRDISCVGLCGQTNGVVCLDREGAVLRPCIIWMDRRSVEEAELTKVEVGQQKFHEITGVLIDPFYSICKILWIKNNEPEIFEKTQTILQPKDYIGFRLTGRRVLDIALASSTGTLDTRKKEYSGEILESLDIPVKKLPELVNPAEIIGELTKESAKGLGLSKGIPVVAGSGDVMVNAIGSGVVNVGQAYAKTATASDIVVSTDKPVLDSKFRFATYIHPSLDKWLFIGGATGGGLCYRWFRQTFGQLEESISRDLGRSPYEIMNEEAEHAQAGCNGLIFLPYLAGVRSPIWDSMARGVYFGIELEHQKCHFIRAILEGVAYSMRRRIEIMENELNVSIKEMRTVGGGGRSSIWRQIIADVTGKTVLLTHGEEHECLGAAILAGVGIQMHPNIDHATNRMVSIMDRNDPNTEAYDKYGVYYQIYASLYDRLRSSFHQLP